MVEFFSYWRREPGLLFPGQCHGLRSTHDNDPTGKKDALPGG